MTDEVYQKLNPVIDRLQEAHFWIHMLETHYHNADPFRWHLNVFLKAIKEVPKVIEMTLQNERGFTAWYAPHQKQLKSDQLLRLLAKRRDFIVHQGMLKLNSRAMIGITEGRGMKAGLTIPIHPLQDSDAGMDLYLRLVKERGDRFGFLQADEDSLPCVYREWRLPEFDSELIDVCAQAWMRTGETIAEVLQWVGAAPLPLSLDCRHSAQLVQFKLYTREQLSERLSKL